jgi:protein O-mannosyl-transferase
MELHDQSESAENVAAALPGTNVPVAGEHSTRWAIMLALALIALAAGAVYCNSFSGMFVFDDASWIEKNTSIRQLWPIWRVFTPSEVEHIGGRPVVSLTLAINHALGGLNVWGYHAMNLLIHVLAAWTLFGVTRRTLTLPHLKERFGSIATPLALVVALLWTIHPLQTESVTYVIQRTEALGGLFYLLTLYCVIRGATACRSTRWYVAATAACLLGGAAKELLVTAPVVVLLYDRTFLAGSFREALRRRWGVYLAMALTWGVVGALLFRTDFYGGTTGFAVQRFTWRSYLLTQPGVIVHYLRLAFWPSGLCLDYGWRPPQMASQVVLPGLLVVGLLALTLWALVKRPAWGFLGAWFFLILAPTSSFVPIRDAAYEHRMYLSLAAVVVGVVIGVWCAGRWLLRRGTIPSRVLQLGDGILVVSTCVALGTLTLQRNLVYQSKVSVWEDAVAKYPGNLRGHYNLAVELVNSRRTEEAIAEYERTLETWPNHADSQYNLGVVLRECRRYDEAIVHFRRAVELKPDYVEAHNSLGLALAEIGKPDEAIAEYQLALKFEPDYADAHNNFAGALLKCGRVDEAIVHFNNALELNPDCMEAHFNLALTLAGRRKFDEALDHFRKAVELKPNYAEGHNNLGNTLASLNRMDEAIHQFRKALEIKPDYADAHNNLGIALARCGLFDEAIVHLRRALEIKPDYAAARRNLDFTVGLQENAKQSKTGKP